MKRLVLLSICLAASAAQAGDWAMRDSDQALDVGEMARIADGAQLTYFDDGVSRFSAGGSYSYTYANQGGTAFGRFRVEPDARICIDYRNGFSRCDMYVRNGGLLILLTEKGERFPIKLELGVKP